MGRYIIRRLLQTIPILFGVSIIIFIIVHSTPGNPYSYLFGPRVDPKLKEKMMVEMGFRDPLPMQYVRWLKTTVSGNLGVSLRTGQPVTELIAKAMPNTLWLSVTSFVLALCLAIPIGIVSATRQYSLLDYGVTTFAFMGISLPSFFAALLAVYVFAVKLQWFPMNGTLSPGKTFAWGDYLYHLILPAVTVALRDIASYSRFTRSSMLEVMRQDYVRTARSKGLAERVVIYKHALRNGLIPVVTLLGFSLPGLFGGLIIIETVFSWNGMGKLSIEAVNNREYGMLMAVNMFFACLVILGNLVADVLYAVVDPRIRYA
ncbi:MAG TPA: ABC transporter permease [Symbiobacteriaceae bacterium]|nr:ABC transporter permease [Symbiobacteriaceae bacterium]